MFDEIVNATVSEISTTGVAQENFELPLPPSSLDSHQTQNNMVKFWTDSTFPILDGGELIHWIDKAKNV